MCDLNYVFCKDGKTGTAGVGNGVKTAISVYKLPREPPQRAAVSYFVATEEKCSLQVFRQSCHLSSAKKYVCDEKR